MDDKLSECLNELFSVMQGELIVGDHKSLSIFGTTEQQKLSEISKEITKLLLKQGYDIEITIDNILDELTKIDFSKQKRIWNPFLRKTGTPQSVLVGQYNATVKFIDKLKVELTLQEAQIHKESILLEKLKSKLEQSADEIQACLNRGEVILESIENSSIVPDCNVEDNDLWKKRLIQKIDDLKVSHTVALQTLTQVGMLIENNKHLSERIQVIISKTIPIWYEQMDAIMEIAGYSNQKKVSQDFADELKILAKMENLDQKIRNVLKDISL